jgi:hypothetical protein
MGVGEERNGKDKLMTEVEQGMTVEEKKLGEEARFCCIKGESGCKFKRRSCCRGEGSFVLEDD